MDSTLKITGTLIVLLLIIGVSFNLINSFTNHAVITALASDLSNIISLMQTLKESGGSGSWRIITINLPKDYSIVFNSETEQIDIHGLEELNYDTGVNITYTVTLEPGLNKLQLYYGDAELKNNTVVFK